MLRMPSRVVFPFGYRISVRQLSDADMDRRTQMPTVSGTTPQRPYTFASDCP